MLFTLSLSLAACGEEPENLEKGIVGSGADAGAGQDTSTAEEKCMVMTVDEENDDAVDLMEVYYYDDNGNVRLRKGDEDVDGTADFAYEFEYDSRNRITSEIHDDDLTADGVAMHRTWEYVEVDGRVVRIFEEFDSQDDGTVDKNATSFFDADALRFKYAGDNDLDGEADYQYEYSYDDKRRLTEERFDAGADGTLDQRFLFTYFEEQGRLVRRKFEWDIDGDGTIDGQGHAYWDADGNRVQEDGDSDLDGTVDFIIDYEFDEEGREIGRHEDSNADGTVDKVNLYEYETDCLL